MDAGMATATYGRGPETVVLSRDRRDRPMGLLPTEEDEKPVDRSFQSRLGANLRRRSEPNRAATKGSGFSGER